MLMLNGLWIGRLGYRMLHIEAIGMLSYLGRVHEHLA